MITNTILNAQINLVCKFIYVMMNWFDNHWYKAYDKSFCTWHQLKVPGVLENMWSMTMFRKALSTLLSGCGQALTTFKTVLTNFSCYKSVVSHAYRRIYRTGRNYPKMLNYSSLSQVSWHSEYCWKQTNIYINKNITNTVFHTHARVIIKSGIRMIELNFHVNILDNT